MWALNPNATEFKPKETYRAKNFAVSIGSPFSPTGVASNGVFSAEKKKQHAKQPYKKTHSLQKPNPIAPPYYEQASPQALHHAKQERLVDTMTSAIDQATANREQTYSKMCSEEQFMAQAEHVDRDYQSSIHAVQNSGIQETQVLHAQYKVSQAHHEQYQQQWIMQQPPYQAPYSNKGTYTSYPATVHHHPSMGMAPIGHAAPLPKYTAADERKPTVAEWDAEHGIKPSVADVSQKQQALKQEAITKTSVTEEGFSTPVRYKKKPVSGEKKPIATPPSSITSQPKNPNNTNLPPKPPGLVRLTSHGQPMTEAIATMITPTTAHILSQVPANYPDLLNALQTALATPGTIHFLSSEEMQNMIITINDEIVRSFYSQVTDREGYSSATPSPTTLLTILHEARDAKKIKDKDHAQKLGGILKKITSVMGTLKAIRDGQPKTPEGEKVSEISRLFVAFFNKIGVVAINALTIYQKTMKTKVAGINIPELRSFFEEERVSNTDVFNFYIQQTQGKKLLSTHMTPKKLKFKKDVHAISGKLAIPVKESGINFSDLIASAAKESGKKLSQKERKKLEQEKNAPKTQEKQEALLEIDKSELLETVKLASINLGDTAPTKGGPEEAHEDGGTEDAEDRLNTSIESAAAADLSFLQYASDDDDT
jgi:hypothetical protein